MKREKEHLIFVEVDWAVIHCLTFSFDYGRIHCGIVLISFCATSRFISVPCCIHFSPSSYIGSGRVVPLQRAFHIPESGWGEGLHSVEADPCVKKRCSCSLKHLPSMSLMKPSIVILEYASDIREEKSPLMEQPGHSYSGGPLTSLGTSCWTLTWPTAATPDQSCPYRLEQSALSMMGASLYKQDLRPESPSLQFQVGNFFFFWPGSGAKLW